MPGKNGLNICTQQEKSYQNDEFFFIGFEKVLKMLTFSWLQQSISPTNRQAFTSFFSSWSWKLRWWEYDSNAGFTGADLVGDYRTLTKWTEIFVYTYKGRVYVCLYITSSPPNCFSDGKNGLRHQIRLGPWIVLRLTRCSQRSVWCSDYENKN